MIKWLKKLNTDERHMRRRSKKKWLKFTKEDAVTSRADKEIIVVMWKTKRG